MFTHWVLCSLNEFNFTYFSLALENLPWKLEIQTFLGKAFSLKSFVFKASLFFWWKSVPLKNLEQLCTSSTYRSVTWRKSAVLDSEDMYWAWQGNALKLVGLGIDIQQTQCLVYNPWNLKEIPKHVKFSQLSRVVSLALQLLSYTCSRLPVNRDKVFSRKQGRLELVLQSGKWK